jgi:4-hydroxyphenylpyruvate dioxygenase-like putative hemolysin
MGEPPTPQMHHVVYAVSPQRLDAATALFEELGFTFVTFELTDLGLSVTLDWAGGVELISPLDTEAGRGSAVAQFLAVRGDGVFAVALRVADIAGAEAMVARYGAVMRFRQHREVDGFELDESEMMVLGLPLTLLATDLP